MSEQPQSSVTFGANAWLVDDMYEQYRQDPMSVSDGWQEFFKDYRPGGANLARPATPGLRLAGEDTGAEVDVDSTPARTTASVSTTSPAGPLPTTTTTTTAADGPSETLASQAEVETPLRGAAARVALNMTASLGVPTATSFRVVPARLLEVNRKILNNQLSRTGSAGRSASPISSATPS
jgi:multifunctional 2-oxoglutarate metabolism enzyme